ncbi:hypothetical protein ASD11_04225 [Aeromicrobium sp. Root495]|uniref:hypothetical protein n=1 Tax=Aeromicrobium sp. Root495 TaxID=1736550 RepID=UPI0006F4FC33|nr:hypothetical protein [Aeromicrobium sp. Root495]KQY58846.1 hypothetical protein ASD11_04225 [Aeromicrobium sp. Root495]
MESAREAALAAVEQFRTDLELVGANKSLHGLVSDVWSQNVDRHEPDTAGDTPRSLGQNCVENLKTIALWRYTHDERQSVENHWNIPGLRVELINNTLTLNLGNRRIVFMKTPPNLGRRPDFARFAKWSTQSEVRLDMAAENTYALNGIKAEDLNQLTMADDPYDPTRVRNFIVVWAGEEDSPRTGAHLTVPILGSSAFAAHAELWHDKSDGVRLRPNVRLPQGAGFDTQPTVEPAITLKARPAAEDKG